MSALIGWKKNSDQVMQYGDEKLQEEERQLIPMNNLIKIIRNTISIHLKEMQN